MNIFELQRDLERKKLRPCYALVGAEHFLRREARRTICRTVVGDGHVEAAIVEYAGDAPLQDVLDELRTPSLFSKKKLVIVEDIRPRKRKKKGEDEEKSQSGMHSDSSGNPEADGAKKGETADSGGGEGFVSKHRASLAKYLKAPGPFSCLLLILEKLDRRSAFAKTLQAMGGIVECGTLSKRPLQGWVVRRATEFGKRIKRDAAELLVDNVGRDMAELDAQLANLASLAGSEQTIGMEHVRDLVPDERKRPIYELTDAVGKRQPGEALKVLEKLLLQNEPVMKIIFVLAKENARIWEASRLLRRGMKPDEMAEVVDVRPPWKAREFAEWARKLSESDLSRNHRLLLKADIDSKTGTSEQSSLLERLVIELCN